MLKIEKIVECLRRLEKFENGLIHESVLSEEAILRCEDYLDRVRQAPGEYFYEINPNGKLLLEKFR